jgi:formylglycine-generating enzyme required for sulfatase activity
MHGNVYEWCQDWYHPNYNGAPADGTPWLSDDDQTRMMRGGPIGDAADNVRCASRIGVDVKDREGPHGFRIVAGARS